MMKNKAKMYSHR